MNSDIVKEGKNKQENEIRAQSSMRNSEQPNIQFQKAMHIHCSHVEFFLEFGRFFFHFMQHTVLGSYDGHFHQLSSLLCGIKDAKTIHFVVYLYNQYN